MGEITPFSDSNLARPRLAPAARVPPMYTPGPPAAAERPTVVYLDKPGRAGASTAPAPPSSRSPSPVRRAAPVAWAPGAATTRLRRVARRPVARAVPDSSDSESVTDIEDESLDEEEDAEEIDIMAEMEPAGPAERRRQSKAEKRGHDLDWAHYEVGLVAFGAT